MSAAALVLLASTTAVEKSVASGPRQALRDNTPADPGIESDTAATPTPMPMEVLSYQDSCDPLSSNPCYQFLIIGSDEEPPPGFEKPFPEFNARDAGFSDGSAAFGFDCSLESNITTDWPINTQLLVRRNVFIPAGATNVRVMVSVDNDIVALFFNETRIAENLVHEGCAIPNEATFSIDVPQEVNGRKLVQPGGNLVVYWLRDRGGGSFFDTSIVAELPPPALNKAVDDLGGIVERRLPRVPVANVTVECSSGGGAPPGPPITIKYQVEASGEAGMITLVPRQTGSITGQMFLDGTLMASVHGGPSTTTITRTNAFLDRPTSSFDPGLESFGSLMSSPAFEAGFNCMSSSLFEGRFRPGLGETHPECVQRCIPVCEQTCEDTLDEADVVIGGTATVTAVLGQPLLDGLFGVGTHWWGTRLAKKCKAECPAKCEKQCPPD